MDQIEVVGYHKVNQRVGPGFRSRFIPVYPHLQRKYILARAEIAQAPLAGPAASPKLT
jgi:hypothetical protein